MKKHFLFCVVLLLSLLSAYAKGPKKLDPLTISEPVQITEISFVLTTDSDTDNAGKNFITNTFPDLLENVKKSVKDQSNIELNSDAFLEAIKDPSFTITCEQIDIDKKLKVNKHTWSNPDKGKITTSAGICVSFVIKDDQTLPSTVTIHQDNPDNNYGNELIIQVPLKIDASNELNEQISIDDFNKTKSVALPIILDKKTYNTLAESDLTIQIHGTTVPTDVYYVDTTAECILMVKVDAILKYGVHKKITYPLIELYNEKGERIEGKIEKYGHAPPKGLDEDSIQEKISYKIDTSGRYYIYVYPEMRTKERYSRELIAVLEVPVAFTHFAQSQYCKYKILVK